MSAQVRQRLVVALGGNALLKRGEALSFGNQQRAAAVAAPMLVELAKSHEVILVHGNGPQVGALALMEQDYSAQKGLKAYPFDCLGAETQGQIGYLISAALMNVPDSKGAVAIVTNTLVDPADPAFANPTKPVGAVYTKEEAERSRAELGWEVREDGDHWRRVVPSPSPTAIVQLPQIKAMLGASEGILICCGGGGVPTVREKDGTLRGVEAVIDKDACAALLAKELDADGLIILTDGGGIWENFGKPDAKEMSKATPGFLAASRAGQAFPGSMGPKVTACVSFVEGKPEGKGYWAAIGSLEDAADIIAGKEGTIITKDMGGDVHGQPSDVEVEWRRK